MKFVFCNEFWSYVAVNSANERDSFVVRISID